MKKYCVIQSGSLTDLLQTKRLILSLCRKEAQVHLCVVPELQDAAAFLYPEVELHPFPFSKEFTNVATSDSIPDHLDLDSFEAVYNLHGSSKNMMMSTLFSSDVMCGYWRHNGREHRSPWLTCLSRVHGRQRFFEYYGYLGAPCSVPNSFPYGESYSHA
jgi:ADP-heptose:LPS heptosyltransferase